MSMQSMEMFVGNPFAATPKAEQETRTMKGVLDAYIAGHITMNTPSRSGNEQQLAKLAGASFGTAETTIGRCHPRIDVPKIILAKGKMIVLVGPNGAGKSTILDAIQELRGAELDLQNGKGAVVYGESVHAKEKTRTSRLNQEELLGVMRDKRVTDVLAYAESAFKEQFPVDWEDISDDAYDRNMANQEAQQRIEELLHKLRKLFRMDEFTDRNVNELSGGERTKLSLCMVLASEPDILLLDEPTNHLDVESLAKLSGILETYARAGVSILSISHVADYLSMAGKDGVLEIKVTPDARTVHASNAPFNQYVRDRSRQPFSIVEKDISWKRAKPKTTGALITPAKRTTTVQDSPLHDVSIPSLLPREVWVLSGNNGSGKTKLMEAMASKTKERGLFERSAASIAYLPQFWPEEVAEGSLEEFFYWVQASINKHSALTSKHFTDAINDVGFKREDIGGKSSGQQLLKKKLSSFSGGEQRLLWFVAVSCIDNVDALLLDEPTNHMDPNLQEWVTKAVQAFPGAVIFSTHDIKLLETIGKDVGDKGSTLSPKNLVFEKKNGRTTVTISDQSPAAYMRSKVAAARNEASRIKI